MFQDSLHLYTSWQRMRVCVCVCACLSVFLHFFIIKETVSVCIERCIYKKGQCKVKKKKKTQFDERSFTLQLWKRKRLFVRKALQSTTLFLFWRLRGDIHNSVSMTSHRDFSSDPAHLQSCNTKVFLFRRAHARKT